MIFYIEKDLKQNSFLKNLIAKYNPDVIFVDNYKNIFDKNFPPGRKQDSIIFANLRWTCLTQAPKDYGHEHFSFFLKNSLNCIFDCRYCYLKWAFKNDFMVFFLNYEDMKAEISQAINKYKNKNKVSPKFNWKLWFYSSDYSDNLAMNGFFNFVEEFVPFFENFSDAMMEIRTKSVNINPFLGLWFIPKNTEIAFSLNPEILIQKYEKGVATLSKRIEAINFLLDKWFKVWLRFLPLLPVKDYQQIYDEFLEYVKSKINFSKIYSVFASGLLYTKDDYLKMIKKDPTFDILYFLKENQDGFVREPEQIRNRFYKKFKDIRSDTMICLDECKMDTVK